MPGLSEPANLPVSQAFAGAYYLEPAGYIAYLNGHPLKASAGAFPGGVYRHDLHKGLDEYGPVGTVLGAMEAGTVSEAFTDGTGARVIRVLIRGHANTRYQYTHCASFLVGVGTKVVHGQPIAKLGNSGALSTGAHNHLEVQIKETARDGVSRWMSYDPARFCLAGTFRFGSGYGGAVIFGGDMIYDERIYPVRGVTINPGTNVRAEPNTASAVLLTTTAATPATQVNELPGGGYEISGVKGYLWAKVKLVIGGKPATAYVAKPLIKV